MSTTLANAPERFGLILTSLAGLMAVTAYVQAADVQSVAAGIRTAATQREDASSGRPLPLAASWSTGHHRFAHDWCAITDYTVWSPQIESMNWLFTLDQARKLNPNFWFELSIWDGNDIPDPARKSPDKSVTYVKAGQTYSPDRYAGFVQFGMWLLRPQVVREFRGWVYSWDNGGPYFLAICEAVDRVHVNPKLREFWQHGKIVANRAAKHPYQENLPADYRDVDRWFLLDTDVMPPRPWKLDTPIPVFALALEKGEDPSRQWLLYAHAPTGERRNVKVVIPNVKTVTVDVPVAGAFFLVDEKTESVTVVEPNTATDFDPHKLVRFYQCQTKTRSNNENHSAQ